MGFRQNNKRKRQQDQTYRAWLVANSDLMSRACLPATVMASRDDWAYFLHYRYHDHGNWHTPPFTWIDFTWDELSPEQEEAVLALEASWEVYSSSHPILAEIIPAQKWV